MGDGCHLEASDAGKEEAHQVPSQSYKTLVVDRLKGFHEVFPGRVCFPSVARSLAACPTLFAVSKDTMTCQFFGCLTITIQSTVAISVHRDKNLRYRVCPLMTFHEAFCQSLTPRTQYIVCLFPAHHAILHVIHLMFQIQHAHITGFGYRFSWSPWLRCSRLVIGERISMNECVSGCSSLDLSESNQITSFEVSIAMFEFPERRVGRASMEHVAYY